MCGRPDNAVLVFAIHAIAAGAAGKKLAQWAVEEQVREDAARWESEREAAERMDLMFAERGQQ